MDVKSQFYVGGEKPKEMDDADRAKVADYVTERLAGFRCPDHDQVPTVMVGGTTLENVTFEVQGCCQKAIQMVKARLAQ